MATTSYIVFEYLRFLSELNKYNVPGSFTYIYIFSLTKYLNNDTNRKMEYDGFAKILIKLLKSNEHTLQLSKFF